MKKMFLNLFLCALSFNSFSQSDFSFTNISLKGSGCLESTYQVVAPPDEKAVSILFDRFSAEVPQYDNINDNAQLPMGIPSEKMDHKVCHISLNANLPVGQRVVGVEASVDFRGMAHLESGTQAIFKSLFLNFRGPERFDSEPKVIAQQTWAPNFSGDWIISNTIMVPINSSCTSPRERSLNFTLRNFITATIDKFQDAKSTHALLSVDSSDVKGSIVLKIKTAPCQITPPTPNTCSGRVVVCRPPLLWDRSLCRCILR